MKKYKGELVLVLVALIWGTGFATTAMVLEQLDTFQILASRFILSALILGAIFFKKLPKLDKTAVRYGVTLGAFLVVGYVFQTIGLKYTTPAKNAFITATPVVMVPFIGTIIYRRKLDLYSVFGAAVAMLGISVLSFKFDSPVNIGDALTFAGTFMFAFQLFYTSEFMARGADVVSVVIVQLVTAGAIAFAAALVTGQTDFSRVRTDGVLILIFMAVFTTAFCFTMQTWGQKHTSETKAVIILSLECVFGAMFSIMFGFESLTVRMFIAALLILGGMMITEIRPRFWGKKEIAEEDA